MDPALGEDGFVEAKYLRHLLDHIVEIVQRLTAALGVPQPAGRAGELPPHLGERVALDVYPWEGAARQVGYGCVPAMRQNLGMLVVHRTMIASCHRRAGMPAAILFCREALVTEGDVGAGRRRPDVPMSGNSIIPAAKRLPLTRRHAA
nr:hypothetical protein [Micromonospora inositola]